MTNEEAINHGKEQLEIFGGEHKEFIKVAIKVLEQQQKTGHWIDTGSGQECSECGEIQYGYDNFRCFCANCGAKMEVEDENKTK